MITVLFACDNKSGQINYLEETPVVATRTLIDGEEMIELDPALLKDTMVIPLSYFTEELQIIKLDGKDEALTGAPYAYVSDNYIMTGMSGASDRDPESIGRYMPQRSTRQANVSTCCPFSAVNCWHTISKERPAPPSRWHMKG